MTASDAAGPPAATAPCLFCQPGHKILCESARFYARFDNHPANPGHVEIVPRRHIESLWELAPDEVFEAWSLLAEARALLDAEYRPDGWTIGVNEGRAAGRSIDHLHVHLIPRHHGDVPDPRGGIRRAAPNCDPDAWTVEAPKRDLAWFLARTPPPDGTPPLRTAAEWNRESVAAFIANHTPKEDPVPDQPAPTGPQDAAAPREPNVYEANRALFEELDREATAAREAHDRDDMDAWATHAGRAAQLYREIAERLGWDTSAPRYDQEETPDV